MKQRNKQYYGAFGFFGFIGFMYFINREVNYLFYFSFFSFFAYFVLGKLLEDTPDERYIENSNKAKLKTASIPLAVLFLIGFSASFSFATKEFVVVVAALGWALTLITYAVLFVYYEKH